MARSKKGNQNRRARAASVASLTTQQRLANAAEILAGVRHAAEDFENAESLARAKTAVRNFLEQGRSLTWALQHLKSAAADDSDWNEWWAAASKELREDPVAQWFYNLRNPIVKEGHSVEIGTVGFLEGTHVLPPPEETRPEGATRYILDNTMTPYWVLPDGTLVPARPIEGLRRWNALVETPLELAGWPLTELMEHYLCVLQRLVDAAVARFTPPAED